MSDFVKKDSIVRTIWGKADTILFIFAGAAAEFALNKAVDWLYFTGKLPSDPLGRLFSTVRYARWIVFSPEEQANQAIDQLRQIHQKVEENRGTSIPDWAYRDVLFMLIYYSIAAYELLENKMSLKEKEEVYDVFLRVGQRMGLQALPETYTQWLPVRQSHMLQDLERGKYTGDLFKQYRKHLGWLRYKMLIEAQQLVVPAPVRNLLLMRRFSLLRPAVLLYKLARLVQTDHLIKTLLLPTKYKQQIDALDVKTP